MAKGPKGKAKAKGKAKPKAKSARKPFVAPISTKTGKAAAAPKVETIRLTPGTKLKSLLSTCRGYKANSDSIISKMREEIAYTVDKHYLDKGAFAELRKYDKMEPEKAAERWHTLVAYMESSGVMAKIESVGRLPLGDEGEEEGEEVGAAAAEKADKAKRKGNGGAKAPAVEPEVQQPDADQAAAEANSDALRSGIKPATDVTKPHFGQAPGGSVHTLPDRKQAH